ncbi:MAG: hypothetical protein M1814_004048 [Vezdaea aestivalis]|nr:MAG: hypothetical protein M1814_004048 [Vezdaea aestivalis]
MANIRLRIDGDVFKDAEGREVTLRGINVAGDAKLPSSPDMLSHVSQGFFEGDDVSFTKRPFTVEEAHTHFARLKSWGYNTIRYIFTWEALEHAGPRQYDEEFIQHTIAVLRVAREYGFYVNMDPHQDVWSRFTGGSGAPMWTVYACGLDPLGFAATEAALVHNVYPEPAKYPKMVWSTNYTRYACQVMWTMFFGGKAFTPKAIIDGKNIQDWLQDLFVDACRHLAQRIDEAGDLLNDVVIGWESVNEPNRGLIGWQDISVIPSEQKLQKGTSPTAWQAILTGSGRSCEIDTWDFGGLGPYKSGTALVDPKGRTAYLPADYDDTKYGWKRDSNWKLGECIWAQHGIWEPSSDILLKKNYFSKDPSTGEKVDYEYFTNNQFMNYYRKYRDAIRSVHHNAIMFCQPPVFEIPPSLKGTKDDDPNMVYAPHFYDGVTLMTKAWNRLWNVDVFGILRGRYLSPVFAIKVGETAIRNCFKEQLAAMKQEGLDYMGRHPTVFTEIGIPYDMDDKYAYKTGDYVSQISALDANYYALEGSGVAGSMLWCYTAINTHEWGDQWNGEDLSIFSLDDRLLPSDPLHSSRNPSSVLSIPTSQSTTRPRSSLDKPPVSPSNLRSSLSTPPIESSPPASSADLSQNPGYRAAEAYVRPSAIATSGKLKSYGFDFRNAVFLLTLEADVPTPEKAPTEIFLPDLHFPREQAAVEVSGGKWTIGVDGDDGEGGLIQRLRWWHGEGEQTLKVTGVSRKTSAAAGAEDEDEGYLRQCQQSQCCVM